MKSSYIPYFSQTTLYFLLLLAACDEEESNSLKKRSTSTFQDGGIPQSDPSGPLETCSAIVACEEKCPNLSSSCVQNCRAQASASAIQTYDMFVQCIWESGCIPSPGEPADPICMGCNCKSLLYSCATKEIAELDPLTPSDIQANLDACPTYECEARLWKEIHEINEVNRKRILIGYPGKHCN